MTKRLFAALTIPYKDSQSLQEVIIKMKKQANDHDIKWEPKANWHLTVRFYGDTEVDRIDALQMELEKHCRDISAFDLEVRGLGAFPEVLSARVIWAGINKTKELVHLRKSLAGDFADPVEFVPHLTLGRMKNAKSVRRLIEPFQRKDFFHFHAESLVLYESIRSNYISTYKKLATIPLK